MFQMRLSNFVLGVVISLLLLILVIFRGDLYDAHIDESIQYLSSDAATYFNLYESIYAESSWDESLPLFLIGSPILFMKLTGGNVFIIQICSLILMGCSLFVGCNCFATWRGRITFIVGALIFPYFLLGFVSLNKEIYAMCSAIFFASYIFKGKVRHLITSFLLAACARYYMVLAILTLFVLIPRDGLPRYKGIYALLLFVTFAAPLAKSLVPGYSSEDLLDVSGASGVVFSKVIDSYGYFFAYPVKYLLLIPQRFYSFLLGGDRYGNGMEAIVSIVSLIIIMFSLRIVVVKKLRSTAIWRLTLAGYTAPIPMMWSDIMHWRYYSFTYFLFLFGVVMYFIEDRRVNKMRQFSLAHA